MSLLELDQVSVQFRVRHAGRGQARSVQALDQVSLAIDAGQTVGLVGESGSGKSTLARVALKLQAPSSGTLRFHEAPVQDGGPSLRRFRSQVQAVFQDPNASLNPRMRVGQSVAEPLLALPRNQRPADIDQRVAQALTDVELPADSARRFPHQFSGGQRQRIAIARALVLRPSLVVLDEPISALDVSIRAQILNLLADLQQRRGMAYLFIAHDLPAVAAISDRIAVMYCGQLVETGPAAQLASDPAHPYTRMLFASVLDPLDTRDWQARLPQGEPASPVAPPSGCRFHPRCPVATARCSTEAPPLHDVDGRQIRCHLFA